ncbi:Uncharacterised protein [uncultured archaeon]|nr:Uncharacterised protein [uncultured archaeon]
MLFNILFVIFFVILTDIVLITVLESVNLIIPEYIFFSGNEGGTGKDRFLRSNPEILVILISPLTTEYSEPAGRDSGGMEAHTSGYLVSRVTFI